jgi:hypothetical protein
MLTSASLPSNSRPGIHCSSGTIDSSRPIRTRPDNRISSRVAVLMILLRNSARLWLSTRELDMGRDLSFKFDRKSFATVRFYCNKSEKRSQFLRLGKLAGMKNWNRRQTKGAVRTRNGVQTAPLCAEKAA